MSESPNVLFLVVDSLRADAVIDNQSYRTPTFDWLKQNSVVFSNCHAQGISTSPSMTAMHTGRYPLDYGGHSYIEPEQPTFAEQFKRNGYQTGAFHSNPYVSSRRNFDKGFDTFEEDVVAFEPNGSLESTPQKVLRLANRLSRILSRTPYTPASEVNKRLMDWTADASEPWFLWTQYMDVHGPYLPGGDFTYWNKFRAEWLWRKAAVNSPDEVTDAQHEELRRNYRKEVEYLDEQIGRLFEYLREDGGLSNTIIIVVGDHGDEFYEHSDYGHSNLAYDELTNVPLLLKFPDDSDLEQPQRINELVRCIDILPSVLDLVDLEATEEMHERMVGESLIPLIQEGKQPSFDHVVTEKRPRNDDYVRISLRTDSWKFLYNSKNEETLLYDLDSDPDEQEDVSDEYPKIASEFMDKLKSRFKRIEETSESVDIDSFNTSAGVEERLRALGYK